MKKQLLFTAAVFAAMFMTQQHAWAQNWTQAGDAITSGSRLGSTNGLPLKFITNNVERMRLDSFGRLALNYGSPIATLAIIKKGSSLPGTIWAPTGTPMFTAFGETNAGNSDFIVGMAGNSFNFRPTFTGRRARGTLAAPAVVQAGDQLVSFAASGYDGSAFQLPATIDFFVDGTPSAGAVPTRISFVTGSNGATRAERLKVGSTGNIYFNSNQLYLLNSSGDLTLGVGNFNMGSDLRTIQFALPTASSAPMMTMFPSGTVNAPRMVLAHSPLYSTWGLQYVDSSDKFNFLSGGTQVQTIDLLNQRVGVGNQAPTAKLHVTNTATTTGLQIDNSYTGNSDLYGVYSVSKQNDGWGYGLFGRGGYMGVYGYSDAGTYTGSGYGVYGIATGSAGTRYGVYGYASGGTDNWGGYFAAKTYASELRVGGTQGATGYVAAINGKLIATEVRVEPQGTWPDYVFGADHKLIPMDELERKINAEQHLPGVPSACEVKENGLLLGDMQTKAMEKIEENTLYILQLNKKTKEIDQLNEKIKELERKIDELSKLIK